MSDNGWAADGAGYDTGQGGGQGRSAKRAKNHKGGYGRPTGRANSNEEGRIEFLSEANMAQTGEWRRDVIDKLGEDPQTTILPEHLDGYDSTEEVHEEAGDSLASAGGAAQGAPRTVTRRKQSRPPKDADEAAKMAARVLKGAITIPNPIGLVAILKTDELKAAFKNVDHQQRLWELRERKVRAYLLSRLQGEMYKDVHAMFDKAEPETVYSAWTGISAKFMNQVEQLLNRRLTCLREGHVHQATKEMDRTVGMHRDEKPTAYIRLVNDLVKEIRSMAKEAKRMHICEAATSGAALLEHMRTAWSRDGRFAEQIRAEVSEWERRAEGDRTYESFCKMLTRAEGLAEAEAARRAS